jgi:predicted dehydrogenase
MKRWHGQDFPIFFDAAATEQRVATLSKAIAAGKHIYSEKPVAPTVVEGVKLLRAAKARGLKTGAVEDKIYLPGLQKLKGLAANNFFGRVTGFQLEFGWWVFDGNERPSQRPSWNYKRNTGGRSHAGYVPALALRDRRHTRADQARRRGHEDHGSRAAR